MTRVHILHFDGCPNVDATADRIRAVAAGLGMDVDLQLVRVASPEEAVRERFLGSPSVRVDGADIDPSARDRSDFGLSCRMYAGVGVPPDAMIAAALTGSSPNKSGRSSAFAIISALVAGALSSAGVSATSLRVLNGDLEPLVAHFNAASDRHHFLAILSPT